MSDMPYNLVGVSLQTKYTTKERTEVRSFAISETIMSYLPVTAPSEELFLNELAKLNVTDNTIFYKI